MKVLNPFKIIHIHPLFLLLALSAFLTGAIYPFIILMSIVVIHELGHFLTAKRYGWRVSRIELWLFGGAVVSEEHNTRPFREQVHVILAGPIQHVWIFGFLYIWQYSFGSHDLLDMAFFYNGIILIFNLLPIWPLDGGKLLFYAANQWLSFQNSLYLTLVTSISVMAVAGIWLAYDGRWTLATVLLAAFLVIENSLEWKRRSFTLMRYLMYCVDRDHESLDMKFKEIDGNSLVRDVIKSIHSNRKHLYVLKQPSSFYIVDEQECLRAFFNEKNADLRMSDIPKIVY